MAPTPRGVASFLFELMLLMLLASARVPLIGAARCLQVPMHLLQVSVIYCTLDMYIEYNPYILVRLCESPDVN